MTAATMRQDTAGKVRRLAADVEGSHPTMGAHNHLRDAARALDSGNHEGAQRHLRAAIEQFTPLSLMRHGHLEDEAHMKGKQHMDAANRMLLLVKDAEDTHYREQEAREARRAMNAPGPVPEGRPDGAARGPTASGPHRVLPARPWQAAAAQSAGPVLTSNVMDLAFNASQPRDRRGRWASTAVETSAYFGGGTHPGSFEHLAAIEDLGRRAASQVSDPAHQSQTMRDALHNVARSLAARDISGARTHMITAHWANRREAGGMWTHELADLDRQIGQVPMRETGFQNRYRNPLNTRHQHPGRFMPTEQMLALANGPQTVGDWAQVYEMALAGDIELSAQTARLAATPAPYGEPGGPGLYHVKGLKHSNYLEQIVHALMTKRGFDKGKATAIARGAIRKWMRGGGHVHPEVRAAAAGAEAQEVAAQARAHAHSNTGPAIELVGPHGYVHGWIKMGVPPTRGELENHMANYHGGNPIAGHQTGHRKMSAAEVRARHEEMHRLGQIGAGHYHDAHTPYRQQLLSNVLDMVGPHGYEHGWVFVGVPKVADIRLAQPGDRIRGSFGGLSAEHEIESVRHGTGSSVLRVRNIDTGEHHTLRIPHPPARQLITSNGPGQEILLFNPNHGPGGRFSTAQNAQQGKGKQKQGKQKPAQHLHNSAQRARAKGQLLATARNDIARADALRAQIRALEAQLRGSSGKTGSTAASSGATKAASTATKAAPGAAAKTGTAGSGTSSRTASRSQIASRIQALRSQVHGLMQAAHAAQAQAAKL